MPSPETHWQTNALQRLESSGRYVKELEKLTYHLPSAERISCNSWLELINCCKLFGNVVRQGFAKYKSDIPVPEGWGLMITYGHHIFFFHPWMMTHPEPDAWHEYIFFFLHSINRDMNPLASVLKWSQFSRHIPLVFFFRK